MPEFISALIYDSAINLAGLERDKNAAIAKLHSIGTEATKTFKNDIARGLAKSVRPENFAADVAQAKALLGGIAPETRKIFERELGRNLARKSLQPFIDETKTLSGQLKGVLASNFSFKNLALGTAGGFGLARIGSELLRFGKDLVVFSTDYETSIAKIRTISGDIDLSNLRDKFKELSQQVPQSLLTLSEGLFNIIGSGVRNSADAFKVLDVSARAATAGFTDTQFAADAIVFAMNAFGKSAAEAEEIANILFKTVDLGKIEFSALASNIGEVANPAKAAGVSLNELGAIIAASTIGGTPVSEAFTGIKNLLSSIIAPTAGAEKALKILSAQAGITGIEFSKASLTAAGGLGKFLQKIQEITGGDSKKLEQLFPEKRALRIAQIVTDNLAPAYQQMGEEIKKVTGLSGEMQKALEIANSTSANQATILINNLTNAVLGLGNGILDVLKPSIEGLNDIFAGKETSILGKFLGFFKRDADFINAQLANIGSNSLPLTNAELLKIVNSTKAISDNVKTLGTTAEKPISLKTVEELEQIAALGGEAAEAARKELKIREDIKRVIEQTGKELEILRTDSAIEAELVRISQKFDSIRENAHGSLIALRQIAILEQAAIDKVIASRGIGVGGIRGGDLSKAITAKLPANFLLDIKSVDLKKTALAKLPDQIRDALSDIGFPFKLFLIDLENAGIATESELVQLADIFDRRLGDVAASLFDFINKLSDPKGTVLGSLLGGFNLLSTAAPLLQNLFGSLFSSGNERSKIASAIQAEEDKRAATERAQAATDELRNAFERLSDTLLTQSLLELEKNLVSTDEAIRNLIGTTKALTKEDLQRSVDLVDFINELKLKLAEAERRGDFDLAEELRAQIQGAENELARLGLDIRKLTAAQIEQLRILFDQKDAIQRQLDLFGKFADNFSGLMEELNFKFQVLNIDDAGQKLDALQKDIKKRFGAIIPVTQSGIRDLIAQGLAALDAGGDTLVRFLKSLDLEEFAPDDLREFLLLLNGLANDLNKQLGEASDAASESVISQVRLATFEQTNALIDNTVTMRIVLTNILDAERQMLELARRNVGLTGSGGAVTGTHDRFFFFNDGVISETTAANLSQLQRRMYNDAAAQAGGKGLS